MRAPCESGEGLSEIIEITDRFLLLFLGMRAPCESGEGLSEIIEDR